MSITLHSYEEVYRPRFFLRTNNVVADDIANHITRFTYEDDEKKFDHVTLEVANPGFRFTNDPRFQTGVRYTLRWGYLTDISEPKTLVITRAKPSFPDGKGMPMVTLVGFDLQKDMNRGSKPTNWGSVASSTIATLIAQRYNLGTRILSSNDARKQARIQSAQLTDFQFLKTLANDLNWDCYVDGDTLCFHPKNFVRPSGLEFTYRFDGKGTLLSFTPDVDTNKPDSVAKKAVDTRTGVIAGKFFDIVIAPGDATILGKTSYLLHPGTGPNAAKTDPVAKSSPEKDPKVVAGHAAALAQKVGMKANKSSANFIGSPQIRARKVIRLLNVGTQFSGLWRITSSRHIIEPKSGYRTEIKLSRDLNLPTKKKAAEGNDPALKPVRDVVLSPQTMSFLGVVPGSFFARGKTSGL